MSVRDVEVFPSPDQRTPALLEIDTLVRLNDPLLESLIRGRTAEQRGRDIERLIVDVARPLSRRILSRYTRGESLMQPHDADDIEAAVVLRLVGKLNAAAVRPDDAVRGFEDYVATLTYNAVNDFLRWRHPERARLKNRLRHVLTHDARLALWQTSAGPACGPAASRGAIAVRDEIALPENHVTPQMLDRAHLADAVAAMFEAAPEPVTFEALVRALAANLSEPRAVDLDARSAEPHAIARFETRIFLRAVWREICLLRPLQRKALLLNLRDGETVNVISLVALTGVASIDEIAAAMEMSQEELAAIWNDLPLDDLRIASMMQVTRQQVINLRKSARERLARRVLRPRP